MIKLIHGYVRDAVRDMVYPPVCHVVRDPSTASVIVLMYPHGSFVHQAGTLGYARVTETTPLPELERALDAAIIAALTVHA